MLKCCFFLSKLTFFPVFSISELRWELSTELKDVLAIVETIYLEERRLSQQKKERLQKLLDSSNQKFETFVSIVGALSLPFVLIASIFGMNLEDLPTEIPFAALMIGTGVSSLVCAFGLLMYSLFHF